MDKTEIYGKLNDLFIADIMGKIIPGAIHNIANPIGGIMGRVQLMRARISKNFQRLESLYPELYKEFSLDKVTRDIDILSGEAEMMLSIFRSLEGKIMALSAQGQEPINISQMIESEAGFADFYLDFKHGVNRTMTFKDDVPLIPGEKAAYSLCISTLINAARQRMESTPEKELAVSVDYDEADITIVFQDSGEEITNSCYKLPDGGDAIPDIEKLPAAEQGLCLAFMLLVRYGFSINVEAGKGRNIISLRIPIPQQSH
jgi:signal transduction histidine kinase